MISLYYFQTRHHFFVCSSINGFTSFFIKQHFLNFNPLPHGHGSLRPTFISYFFGSEGTRSFSTSDMSSLFFGSIPTIISQPCLLQSSIISSARFAVFTRTTAGRFILPNFARIFSSLSSERTILECIIKQLFFKFSFLAPI